MNTISIKTLALWKKIALATAFFIILHAVTGFLILPAIIKNVSITQLTKAFKRDVTIRKVRVNPYILCLSIEGFTLMEQDKLKPFFSFEAFNINLGIDSILKLAPVLQDLSIDRPVLHLVRRNNNLYNFSDLLPHEASSKIKKEAAPSGFFKFILTNLSINNGRIEIQDKLKGKTHILDQISLDLPFVSSMAGYGDTFVKPTLSVMINDAPLIFSGETKPFSNSLETAIKLDLKRINLKPYFSYLPIETAIKSIEGTAELSFSLAFLKNGAKAPTLSLSGALNLTDLSVDSIQGDTLLKLAGLEIKLKPSTPLDGNFNIGRIILDSPRIHLIRDAGGLLNLQNLTAVKKSVAEAEQTSVTTPITETKQTSANTAITETKQTSANTAITETKQPSFPITITIDETRISNGEVLTTDRFKPQDTKPETQTLATIVSLVAANTKIDTKEMLINLESLTADHGIVNIQRLANNRLNLEILNAEKPAREAIQEPSPWKAGIGEVLLEDFSIRGEGLASPGKGDIILDKLRLSAKAISTDLNKKAAVDLGLKINTTGELGLNGEIGINPVTADLGVNIDGINLPWAQPFLTDYLNITLSTGKLAVHGNLAMENPGTSDFKANFTGKADIADLSITDHGSELIAWKSLSFKGLDLNALPLQASNTSSFHASIDEILLERPFGRIVIDQDRELNLKKFLKPQKKILEPQKKGVKEPEDKDPQKAVAISIKKITMDEGNLDVTDRSIQPEFKGTLSQINATIKNIDSRDAKRAAIELNAKVNRYASLEMTGEINPLQENLFLDTQIKLKDLDLGPVSPYSGRYAGYTIQKGKLSMDLSYHIDNQILDSTNNLFLDKFDFGEPTKSEFAIDAPVKFAIALLKDTRGKIRLDLPVKGNLNDPQFSLGGIIVKMVKNLLAKAATSPFALLGSMFGGKEDLNIIEFPLGETGLTPEATEKIAVLSKALGERPGLGLEITGHADLEKDTRAIEDQRFNTTLKAFKLADMNEKGNKGMAVDEVMLSDQEFVHYLNKAYAASLAALNITPGDKPGITSNGNEPDLSQMEEVVRKTIIIDNNDLEHLAHARALTVADYLLASGAVDAGRIFMMAPKSLKSERGEENVTKALVLLNLK